MTKLMTFSFFQFVRAAVLLLLVVALPGAAQKHYTQLTYPPLEDIEIPAVERFELPNGLVVFLVEDHTLPKVEGHVLVHTGSRFEPADKVGLASIVGQVIRTGGTTTRKGEEIDRILANVGASVETSVGTNSAEASMFSLKENASEVLAILADLLRDPAFPDDKLELAKVQQRTAIARRNDNVGTIANREFLKLVYGRDHPYARHAEFETIANVTPKDLAAFHEKYFHPNNTLLGLWGDFDTTTMKQEVERLFGSWPRGEVALPPLPAVPQSWQGSVNLIQKEDVNQTNIRIGHLGGQRNDEDYFALRVMAEVLGGGFSSRLFRHIRSDLGLAYSVGAAWNASYDHAGVFLVTCGTKSESTVKATQEILEEIRRLPRERVTAEELQTAKESILNSYVFNFDTTGEIVRRLMTYEYYGYPRDFLQKFKDNVEKVTAEDVLQAAQEHLAPENVVILAVGQKQDFDQPLSSLGAVNSIDITIPKPGPELTGLPEPTLASVERGKKILQATIEGMGGLETLQGVHNYTSLMRVRQVTPQGELPLTVKVFVEFPQKTRRNVVTPMGEISMVYTGEKGWRETPGGSQELGPQELKVAKKAMARNVIRTLLEAQQGERTVQFLETVSVDGQDADIIAITDKETGDVVRLYVEQSTGRVLRQVFRGKSPSRGDVREEHVFSDHRPVEGLTLPFKILVLHDNAKFRETTVDSYEVNIHLDPDLFVQKEGTVEEKNR